MRDGLSVPIITRDLETIPDLLRLVGDSPIHDEHAVIRQ